MHPYKKRMTSYNLKWVDATWNINCERLGNYIVLHFEKFAVENTIYTKYVA
jgi:hypothetical protein